MKSSVVIAEENIYSKLVTKRLGAFFLQKASVLKMSLLVKGFGESSSRHAKSGGKDKGRQLSVSSVDVSAIKHDAGVQVPQQTIG